MGEAIPPIARKPSGKADPDRDHFSNRREYRLRTDPRNHDTDGDDYKDRIEVRKGTNPRARSNDRLSEPGEHRRTGGLEAGPDPLDGYDGDDPGAVVQDVRFTDGADLFVEANNVTVRRVEFQGGLISNDHNGCHPGMLLEQVSMVAPDHAGRKFPGGGDLLRRLYGPQGEDHRPLGGLPGLGLWPGDDRGLLRQDRPPVPCGDWHGDGIQGYFGLGVAVHNVTIDMRTTGCGGTSPFFYDGLPHNGNKGPVIVDRLLVMGQGFPFRLGVPGSVSGLNIVDGSWQYGPIDVDCSAVSNWNADIVQITSKYKVARTVRSQRCTRTGN